MRFTLPSKSSAHWLRLHVAKVMRLDVRAYAGDDDDDDGSSAADDAAAPPALGCLRNALLSEDIVPQTEAFQLYSSYWIFGCESRESMCLGRGKGKEKRIRGLSKFSYYRLNN